MSSALPDEQYDLPFPDRRTVARARMASADSRLSVSGLERVCRVRDLSPIGVGLETRDPPQPGQRVWVEMDAIARLPAVVIWRDPGRCGLRFEEQQAVPTPVEAAARPGKKPRTTRFLL